MQKRLRELADHKLVGEVRGVGLIARRRTGARQGDPKATWEQARRASAGTGQRLHAGERRDLAQHGRDAVAFCPPLIITEQQVDTMVDALAKSLDQAASQVRA